MFGIPDQNRVSGEYGRRQQGHDLLEPADQLEKLSGSPHKDGRWKGVLSPMGPVYHRIDGQMVPHDLADMYLQDEDGTESVAGR